MDVVREFTFHAALGDSFQMRGGPFGDRVAAAVGDGWVKGDRISGRLGDNYWFTHVRLESGAPTYQWVNRTLFIGQGRAVTDGIEYEVYRLA